jgi:hypothetical protein
MGPYRLWSAHTRGEGRDHSWRANCLAGDGDGSELILTRLNSVVVCTQLWFEDQTHMNKIVRAHAHDGHGDVDLNGTGQ